MPGHLPPINSSAAVLSSKAGICGGRGFHLHPLFAPRCGQIYQELRYKHGVQFFDTAEGYGGGTSEERLGDLMAQERQDATDAGANLHPPIIGTKFLPQLARWTKWSLHRALAASNSRLGLQASDIYFIHTPVHPMPLEHWVAAAAREANKGHAKALGLSNCNAEQVGYKQALCIHSFHTMLKMRSHMSHMWKGMCLSCMILSLSLSLSLTHTHTHTHTHRLYSPVLPAPPLLRRVIACRDLSCRLVSSPLLSSPLPALSSGACSITAHSLPSALPLLPRTVPRSPVSCSLGAHPIASCAPPQPLWIVSLFLSWLNGYSQVSNDSSLP